MTSPWPRRIRIWKLASAMLVLLVSGCANPVSVSHVDIQTAYRLNNENALSAGRPSEAAKTVLRRQGLLDRFETEPVRVLDVLHRGLQPAGDEDRLFALAELSFLHGQQTGDRAYYLASAVYAWALLFPGAGQGSQFQSSEPRLRLTYDLYNQAVAQSFGSGHDDESEMWLQPGLRKLPFGTLQVSLDPGGLRWGGYRLEHLIPTSTLAVDGFRNHYRTPGLGASLAASIAYGSEEAATPGAKRLGANTKVPLTLLLRIDHARAKLASGRLTGRLEVYAADQARTVTVDGREETLESDPTAALAYQLDKSPLYAMEIKAFLRGGFLRSQIVKDRTQDGLFTFQPYRPGKIPVVLVHGTLSSPARWAELVNELQGDPVIRERYQIWLFLYDSGNPIAYSAGRLRGALVDTLKELDPQGQDTALRRMVVIGHSQGGLLTKATAIDTGNRVWERISSKPFDQIQVSPETRQLLQRTAFFTPLPFVDRVIFIATPHRGALLATGRIGAIATRLITLPLGIFAQAAQAATLSGDEKLTEYLRRPPTAIDGMNPDNPGIQLLSSIKVDARIPAYSIICVKGNGPIEQGDDGVVAYRSAHIDEAVSEKVVRWDHSCQGQPEVIEEVRRILLEELATPAVQRP